MNNIINQLDLFDICTILHPTMGENYFQECVHQDRSNSGPWNKPKKFLSPETVQGYIPLPHGIKFEISNKKTTKITKHLETENHTSIIHVSAKKYKRHWRIYCTEDYKITHNQICVM